MALLRQLKRKFKAAVPPVVFLALVGYFLNSAANGDRGWHAMATRSGDLHLAQQELEQAIADKVAWQRRVAGLQNSHLDADTLDERARAMLNMADPADIVVPYAHDRRLF